MKHDPWETFHLSLRGKFHLELPVITKFLKKEKVQKVLDFCCGAGRNSIYLSRQGFIVYGFDRSENAIARAKSTMKEDKLKAHLIVRDMFDPLPYKDGFFDAVFSIRAMYHGKLVNLRKVIVEVARVIKVGGFLYWHGATVKGWKKYNKSNEYKLLEDMTYLSTEGEFKGTVRHFFNKEKEIVKFLKGHFNIISIEFRNNDYYVIAQKK
ncbi:MAG TPA: class I SAM-dependent methyltransferase [Candidatus Acidoferrum sp.]|nr:class I SAM-dependent methyltransferase [Candidatus Acidoferrum sp.]